MDNTAQASPTPASSPRVLVRAAVKVTATVAAAGLAALLAAGATPARADAAPRRTLWVAAGAGCSDGAAGTRTSPLCGINRAAALAKPGDTILIRAGRYAGTLAPRRSGRPGAPISFTAAGPGVTIAAAGRPTGINLIGVHDLRFTGLTVTGAGGKGVWVSRSARIVFSHVTVRANRGPGVQLKQSRDVTIDHSTISANRGAGIMELGGVTRGRYTASTIGGNGHDGRAFNGDGVILNGSGALVRGDTITGNGDHRLYEHGIYASRRASGYLIVGNRLAGNSATGVKAQGSGSVRANSFGSSRFAIWVDASSRTGVAISGNAFKGTFARTVATGAGARVRLNGNHVTRAD